MQEIQDIAYQRQCTLPSSWMKEVHSPEYIDQALIIIKEQVDLDEPDCTRLSENMLAARVVLAVFSRILPPIEVSWMANL